MKKDFRAGFFVLIAIVFLLAPSVTRAETSADVRIDLLRAQIALLLEQIKQIQTSEQPAVFCYAFNKDITFGSRSEDVVALRKALQIQGLSPVSETSFSEETAADVVQLQAKLGVRQTGYVGPLTRAKLNVLYRCGSVVSTETSQAVFPELLLPGFDSSKSSSFAMVTIAGKQENKKVSTWKLHLDCSSGVAVGNKFGNNICGTDIKVATANLFDPTANYPILSLGADNSAKSQGSVTLSLVAYDSSGKKIGTDTEQVFLAGAPAFNAPSVSLSANLALGSVTITEGQSVTFNWGGTNTVSCSSTGGTSNWAQSSRPALGQVELIDPLRVSATYTITCVNRDGVPASSSVTVNVREATPSITVLSPNGGEEYGAGFGKDVDFRVKWTSQNLSGTASIYLNARDGATCFLGTAPVSRGDFPVSLGNDFRCPNIARTIRSGEYRIVIDTDTNPNDNVLGVNDSSDGFFGLSVAASSLSLTMTSPQHNDSLAQNGAYLFQWQTVGLSTSNPVYIEFIGNGRSYVIARNLSNTGRAQISVSADVNGLVLPLGTYSVRICAEQKESICDERTVRYEFKG